MNTQELLNILKIVGSTLFGMLAMHGYMTTAQASAIMGDLTIAVPALLSAGTMAWSIYAHWNMKKVPENSVAIAKDDIAGTAVAGTTAMAKQPIVKVVGALLFALAVGLLAPREASAQAKLTGNIVRDIANANRPAASTITNQGACDISLFTTLTVQNVVESIKNCVGSVVAGGAKPFVDDITDALASAKTANDGTAVACLTPALAIATAAQGTPAVVAADGTVTTPAKYPGPILIFQKYREFVNAGGPSNCKTAVQSTINGTVASAL